MRDRVLLGCPRRTRSSIWQISSRRLWPRRRGIFCWISLCIKPAHQARFLPQCGFPWRCGQCLFVELVDWLRIGSEGLCSQFGGTERNLLRSFNGTDAGIGVDDSYRRPRLLDRRTWLLESVTEVNTTRSGCWCISWSFTHSLILLIRIVVTRITRAGLV